MKKIVLLLAVVLVSCSEPVRIVKFNTLPEIPFKGDTVWVYWLVENATSVTLDGVSVNSDSGAVKVLLDRTRTFELVAKGPRSEAVNKLNVVAE